MYSVFKSFFRKLTGKSGEFIFNALSTFGVIHRNIFFELFFFHVGLLLNVWKQ